MTNKELDELVNQELEKWGAAVLLRLANELRRKKMVLTEETLKSLQQEVLRATSSGIQGLELAFAESGRIRDMRGVVYSKRPPVEAMEKWVKDVGLSKFKYVPGYKKDKTQISDSIAIKRIAWGIAANKLAVNTHKPKKWFAKPFYGMINPLIDNIVTKYQQATGEAIGGAFDF